MNKQRKHNIGFAKIWENSNKMLITLFDTVVLTLIIHFPIKQT